MKKLSTIFRFLTAALALAALGACNTSGPEQPAFTDELIRISAKGSDVRTKGLLNSADLKKEGTQIKVYDYLTGFTGKINGVEVTPEQTVEYFNDFAVCQATGTDNWLWNGHQWRWTSTGTHTFIGWLAKDGTTDNPFNVSFDGTDKVLSVPSITFTKDSPQFDFSYSDVVSVDVQSNAFNASQSINLPLNHLFTALAVTLENAGDDQVTIKQVTISGVNNTKKSAINYTSSPVNVTFSGSNSSNFLADLGTGVELNNGTIRDLYTGDVAGEAHNYILMWPQTADEMNAASITILYNIAGAYEEDGVTPLIFDITVPLNKNHDFDQGMTAGYKHAINLKFAGKTIDLKLTVLPWDYNEYNYDYSDAAIDSGPDGVGEMDFNQLYAGYNRAARTMTLQNQSDVLTGTIQIYGPHSGRWAITPWSDDGALDYFTVSPTEGEIDFDLSVGKQVVDFTVTPSTTAPASTVKLHFSVAIQLNGEWVDANSEFNRKDWKIVWER